MSAKAFVQLPNGEIVYPPARIEIAGRQFEMTTVARGLVAQRRECWEVGPIPVEVDPDEALRLSELAWHLVYNPFESPEPLCNAGTLRFRGSAVAWLAWTKTLDQYIHGERGVTCHD